jgi:Holliday junction resolvasome RuvABC endonuclease subunit
MSHNGTHAAHVYGGYLAILQMYCAEKGIECIGVPVGTIKKHITGKGNATKQEVIDAVQEMGYSPKDDNEADAIALLYYQLGVQK